MARTATPQLLLLPLVALACASPPPQPSPPEWTDARRASAAGLAERLRAAAVAPAGQVVVRLAFSREADLDLYVTDPSLETVYYANTPSRGGGKLDRDCRCDDPDARAIRVETVSFDRPANGRYRVGVDYPQRCDGGDIVTYAISVETGGRRTIDAGLVRWLDFSPVVTEFEVR